MYSGLSSFRPFIFLLNISADAAYQSTDYPSTLLSQQKSLKVYQSLFIYLNKTTQTRKIIQNFTKSITNYKVKCLPEVWRQDAAEKGSLELAYVCEKEKRAREEQEREEKTRFLTYFRWVFLEFFSSRSKISAKYLLCEIAILV
jgi:hypothetical protein